MAGPSKYDYISFHCDYSKKISKLLVLLKLVKNYWNYWIFYQLLNNFKILLTIHLQFFDSKLKFSDDNFLISLFIHVIDSFIHIGGKRYMNWMRNANITMRQMQSSIRRRNNSTSPKYVRPNRKVRKKKVSSENQIATRNKSCSRTSRNSRTRLLWRKTCKPKTWVWKWLWIIAYCNKEIQNIQLIIIFFFLN